MPFNNTSTSSSGSSSASTSVQASANASDSSTDAQTATSNLEPATGYGGIYVQVSGAYWPQNMMVLVTLEDDQGRSETLAASDTDQTGNLSTGFLYPIDQRWLASDSAWVVSTTADGKVETKTKFTIVPPGEETALTSPLATATAGDESTSSTGSTGSITATTTSTMTTTAGTKNKEWDHVLTLPLIAAAETARASNPGAKQVKISVEPGSINCRDGNEWFKVAILSGTDFNAPSVDPNSLSVFGESGSEVGHLNSPLNSLMFGSTQPVSFHASSKNRPSALQHSANLSYRWRWYLEDANQDGNTDMVMEFQVGYTDLTCDAAFVVVTGRTKDGGSFEGSDPITMIGLDQG